MLIEADRIILERTERAERSGLIQEAHFRHNKLQGDVVVGGKYIIVLSGDFGAVGN